MSVLAPLWLIWLIVQSTTRIKGPLKAGGYPTVGSQTHRHTSLAGPSISLFMNQMISEGILSATSNLATQPLYQQSKLFFRN